MGDQTVTISKGYTQRDSSFVFPVIASPRPFFRTGPLHKLPLHTRLAAGNDGRSITTSRLLTIPLDENSVKTGAHYSNISQIKKPTMSLSPHARAGPHLCPPIAVPFDIRRQPTFSRTSLLRVTPCQFAGVKRIILLRSYMHQRPTRAPLHREHVASLPTPPQ